MASCSKGRVAPAPAGASRLAELSFRAPRLPPPSPRLRLAARCGVWLLTAAPPCAVPPPCRSSIAAMTWPLRIRPVPMMPIDCARRCRSGRSIADSPVPPRRLAPDVTVPPLPDGSAAPEPLRAADAAEGAVSPARESASGQERTALRGSGEVLAAPASGEVPARPVVSGASPDHPDAAVGSSDVPEEPVIRSVVSLTRGPSQGAGCRADSVAATRCHAPAN